MIGSFITFLGVCALVAIYMAIAHSFLRGAEEPEDLARERQLREVPKDGDGQPPAASSHESSQPHWAH